MKWPLKWKQGKHLGDYWGIPRRAGGNIAGGVRKNWEINLKHVFPGNLKENRDGLDEVCVSVILNARKTIFNWKRLKESPIKINTGGDISKLVI